MSGHTGYRGYTGYERDTTAASFDADVFTQWISLTGG
jgi:hypothetical protein